MLERWQPYPNHPAVRERTERVVRLQTRIGTALAGGDLDSVQHLVDERRAVEADLRQVTEALLREPPPAPRWAEPSPAELAGGAIQCLACGNSIAVGEPACSYCGWTYSEEPEAADRGG